MCFKTDENLPQLVTRRLRSHDLDVVSSAEQRLDGASDARFADVCRAERRVPSTLDLDFADIRRYPPGAGPGIVLLRPRSQARVDTAHVTELLARTLANDAVDGALCIVEHRRFRVRDTGPPGPPQESR